LQREFDEEQDDDRIDGAVHRDREISLGTTTLLGIFFALALLCAVFFGFGYSLGSSRHADQASTPTDPTSSSAASSPDFNSFKKPSPGSTLNQPSNYPSPPAGSVPVATIVKPQPASKPTYDPDANIVTSVRPNGSGSQYSSQSSVPPAPAATPAPPPSAPKPAIQAAPPAPASFMVQIAAVTHQEDADLLLSTLKRRGYAVAIRTSPQDNLLHVQVGPFAQRTAAEAMRQKLLADGFNAILK
jgi:cell division septation protein DedD